MRSGSPVHIVRGIRISVALVCSLCFLVISRPAQAQTYKVIYNFTVDGGATPYGGPIFDQSGNLVGTTNLGGKFGAGTVYKLTPDGSSWDYHPFYSFKGLSDGSAPEFGSLAMGPGGAFFGTTEGGGFFGTAFAVCESCPRLETVVHSFGHGTDGQEPVGGLVFDSKGNFYGTTLLGGTFGGGTVFEGTHMYSRWVVRVIYNFGADSTDAINPPAGVTVDAQGNLYGTSSFGGANGVGAIYKLTPSASGWSESILYSFAGQDDGENPVGGLILDKAGNLYGGTFDGGANGGGTVYELSPSAGGAWTFKILYSLTGGFGGPYNKLTFDTKGNLYGFTNGEGLYGFGSVFKLTPSNGSWAFTDLYDFTNGLDGGLPYGSVAVDHNGNVFGTAVTGGTENQGVLFEITP